MKSRIYLEKVPAMTNNTLALNSSFVDSNPIKL